MTVNLELLKQLWANGVSVKEISRQLGVSKSCAHDYAINKLKLPRRELGSRAFSWKVAADLYLNSNATLMQIAKKFGVSHTTVSRVLRSHGIQTNKFAVKGSSLTRTIVRLYRETKLTQKQIADGLGVHVSCVGWRIRQVLGTRWGSKRWMPR